MKKVVLTACILLCSWITALAQQPVVAIHVSELTQALETMPANAPTPSGPGTTGMQWWTTAWHYFVMSEAVKEALRSDGTPYVVVTDADISAGNLLTQSGAPNYPIVISLASEAIRDDEVTPLQNYVSAGGFLLVGSSSFTRNPDGTTRTDFALANALGLHMANTNLQNWYANTTFSKVLNHRLISHIPAGDLNWTMPLASEDIPWGVSVGETGPPGHVIQPYHYVWQVNNGDATVLANTAAGQPYITVKPFGKGYFIYDAGMQPIIGSGGYAPGMYAYGIFRNAIEWAFEAADLPIMKVSPWPYQYNAAYVVRHDFENLQNEISAIQTSAQVDSTFGAKGDYYFCTGTLRVEMNNDPTAIQGLRNAVSLYGATIGSHNGGLNNPSNSSLVLSDYDYWHWGPDESLDATPPGYANGSQYANTSIGNSLNDIGGWLQGINTNTRTFVAPYFNATREGSYQLLDSLGIVTSGEQKDSPFPHWTVSTQTQGKRYRFLTLPVSDWYIGSTVGQSMEAGHTTATIDALVDYYYNLGALINLYMHQTSDQANPTEYLRHASAEPNIWAVNAPSVYSWWQARTPVQIVPSYNLANNRLIATASVSGATDANTAVEVVVPNWAVNSSGLQVKLDGAIASPSSYRVYRNGIKIDVGTSVSTVEVSYPFQPVAVNDSYQESGSSLTVTSPGVLGNDSNPGGGPITAQLASQASHGTVSLNADGSFTYTPNSGYSGVDTFAYQDNASGTLSNVGNVSVMVLPAGGQVAFFDDFGGQPGADPFWTTVLGTWNVTNGTMQGSSPASSYGLAYAKGNWTDYSVQANVQFPSGAFGGGIGGRVNTATGAHYGAWIYPEGSPAGTGSAILRLIKFEGWTSWSGTPMAQVTLPNVGTTAHTLQLSVQANSVLVSVDGTQYINVSDANFDSVAPYTNGAISLDMWTNTTAYVMTVANVTVSTSGSAPTASNEGYTMTQGTTLSVSAPGVLSNDSGNSTLTASLVTAPANGSLTLNANGSFTYTPSAAFSGTDSFAYRANASGIPSNVANVSIMALPSGGQVLFLDDFSGQPGADPFWTTMLGSWNISNGTLQGSSSTNSYGMAYANGNWSDYSVKAHLQFSSGAFGAGIGGRVNTATGAHYGAWIYPEGSPAGTGSAMVSLIKFEGWTTWTGTPMAQANLPNLGTSAHMLQLTLQGMNLQISLDGTQYINVADAAFDSVPAYTNGAISLDMWTAATPSIITADDVTVQTLSAAPVAVNDSFNMGQGATLSVSAPGILANDSGGVGSTASLVTGPANGTLALNSDGSFTYIPISTFSGTDTFTYREISGNNQSNAASVTITVTALVAVQSVAVNPASVAGGSSSSGTVTLTAPATSSTTVTLSSSNSSLASVPANVTVAANSSTATFNLTTVPVGTSTQVSISATLNGTVSTTLTVTPPGIASVTLNPASVQGGVSSTGTVTLSSAAPSTGAAVSLSSSDTSAAQVPASVTVAGGATTATFTVTTTAVSSVRSVTMTGTYAGLSKTGTLTVNPPSLASVTLNPSSVVGGTSSTGRVTLNSIAPTGGTVVALSSSNTAAARVPASVTVSAGATTATFTVTTSPVANVVTVMITGVYGATQIQTLTITPPTLSSVTLNPTSVLGGNSSIGTATLNGAAPSGGVTVALSANSASAQTPTSVTVPAGSTSATFTVTTTPVSSVTTATIAGVYGTTRTGTLTISPPALSSIMLNPSSVTGGASSTGTVTLNGRAPSGGAVVTLTSSNTNAATVPSSITVAAGTTSTTFTVTTGTVGTSTPVTISGLYGVTRSQTLTVLPPPIASLTLNPATILAAQSSTGTVTLGSPAPAGGVVVSLSDNANWAQVPSTVVVPAGAISVQFIVTTSKKKIGTVTITAKVPGSTRSATLTVL
jgi:Bacterial Ig domain